MLFCLHGTNWEAVHWLQLRFKIKRSHQPTNQPLPPNQHQPTRLHHPSPAHQSSFNELIIHCFRVVTPHQRQLCLVLVHSLTICCAVFHTQILYIQRCTVRCALHRHHNSGGIWADLQLATNSRPIYCPVIQAIGVEAIFSITLFFLLFSSQYHTNKSVFSCLTIRDLHKIPPSPSRAF